MGGANLLENQIETMVGHYLRSEGVFFWKTTSSGYFDPKIKRFRTQQSPFALKGCPDIICIIQGKFIGIEIKTSTGRQSDAQKDFEKRIKRAGGEYYLVRSLEEVKIYLKGILCQG